MRLLPRLVVLGVALLVPLTSQATLLGSFSRSVTSNNFHVASSTASIGVLFCAYDADFNPCFAADPHSTFFFDNILSTADAGSTFVATSATPGFALAAQLLTNGVIDQVLVLYGPTGGGGINGAGNNEAGAFYGDFTGAHGIDFAGYEIDSIQLTLSNDFSVTAQPSLNNTLVNGSISVQVFGQLVPEPSTLLLLGSGIAGFALVGRSKRSE